MSKTDRILSIVFLCICFLVILAQQIIIMNQKHIPVTIHEVIATVRVYSNTENDDHTTTITYLAQKYFQTNYRPQGSRIMNCLTDVEVSSVEYEKNVDTKKGPLMADIITIYAMSSGNILAQKIIAKEYRLW